jgi:P4 family phage/plasmid primase-like protien
MLSFVRENKMRFITFNIKFSNDLKKKKYIDQVLEWEKNSFEELNELNDKRKLKADYILLRPDGYIIFDTDEEKQYTKLVKILKELNIYNEDAITTSTRGHLKQFSYKRHFWFKIEDPEFKNFKKHHIGDLETFVGGSSNLAEKINTKLTNITSLSHSDYKKIVNLYCDNFSDDEDDYVNIESDDIEDEKEEQKDNKTEKKTYLNKKISAEQLIKILDNLNVKRYEIYDYWLILWFIFVNEHLDYNLFHTYSKKAPKKYDYKKNIALLKNIKPKKGYTVSTLFLWLKEDNITVFNELLKERISENFWSIELNNISIADFYYEIDPDTYIFTYDNGWYEYDENNILINRIDIPITLSNGLGRKLQKMASEQRNLITPNDPKYDDYMKYYKLFYKTVGTNKFIKDVIEQLKHHYYVDLTDKLHNKNLFAFKNLVFDMEEKKYRMIEKKDYITKNTNYDMDLSNCNEENKNKIKKFLFSLFEDEKMVEYWLNITGNQLFGNDGEQKIYIYSGSGSNGKSLTQKLLSVALGDYYISVANNFLSGSIKKGGADPEMINCIGTRYLSVSEPDDTEGKKFNVANLKNWSGSDKQSCRGLYSKKPTYFYPQFTININCNDLPELSSVDDGLKRRLRHLVYPFQFKEGSQLNKKPNNRLININLSNEILKTEVIQSFIHLLIEHAQKVKGNIIYTPEKVLLASNKYCDENNPLYSWFSETIEITNNKEDTIPSGILLNDYNNSQYCEKKLRPKDFSSLMQKLNIEKDDTKKIVKYLKVKYIDKDEFE